MFKHPHMLLCCAALLASTLAVADDGPVKLGLIGLDTSHVIAFTSILNDANHGEHVPGARVVAAVKAGSPDIPSSADRVEGYTEQLRDKFGVEIVGTIPELCERVDVVLITSVDGRPDLEQAKPVIAAGLPFFIDKPVGASYEDVLQIARLAKAAGVPWFGGSSLRWYSGVREAIDPEKVGDILGCDAYSPCSIEPHHPDLYWYGVHGVEILYAAMGPGCKSVSRASTGGTDVVVGIWEDGRIGTFRGTRTGGHGYGATIFGTKAVTTAEGHSYKGLIEQIVTFAQTGVAPMTPEELVEVAAFMELADESKAQGGAVVAMPEIDLR